MRKVFAYIKTSVSSAFSYRGDILLFVVGGISQQIFALLLWLGIEYSGGNIPVTNNNLIVYFLVGIIYSYLSSTWGSLFITKDIQEGSLTPYLLKPTEYLYYQISNNIGEKIVKAIYIFPLVITLGFIFRVTLNFNASGILMSLVSLVMACLLSFLIDMCIGVSAFFLQETEALDDTNGIGSTLFSGRIIPFFALPKFLIPVATILPFRYTLSLPIEIIQGTVTENRLITGLIIQLSWLVLFYMLYKLLWSKGLRNYSAYSPQ